jgi:hypothetical protein
MILLVKIQHVLTSGRNVVWGLPMQIIARHIIGEIAVLQEWFYAEQFAA